jgi:hypothetical protein
MIESLIENWPFLLGVQVLGCFAPAALVLREALCGVEVFRACGAGVKVSRVTRSAM